MEGNLLINGSSCNGSFFIVPAVYSYGTLLRRTLVPQ